MTHVLLPPGLKYSLLTVGLQAIKPGLDLLKFTIFPFCSVDFIYQLSLQQCFFLRYLGLLLFGLSNFLCHNFLAFLQQAFLFFYRSSLVEKFNCYHVFFLKMRSCCFVNILKKSNCIVLFTLNITLLFMHFYFSLPEDILQFEHFFFQTSYTWQLLQHFVPRFTHLITLFYQYLYFIRKIFVRELCF